MFTAAGCVYLCDSEPTCASADFNLDSEECYTHSTTAARNCNDAYLEQDLDVDNRIKEVYHFKKVVCRKYFYFFFVVLANEGIFLNIILIMPYYG